MRYAANTIVSVESSKEEINRILERYGAKAITYGHVDGQTELQFAFKEQIVKFRVPAVDVYEVTTTRAGLGRTILQVEQQTLQARRQRWRALALIIKAKLEAVESGIVPFEGEFMHNLVIEHGKTVGDVILPQIEKRRIALTSKPQSLNIIAQ